MYIYAQLNDEGIVVAVSSLSSVIENDQMIALSFLDYSVLGKRYENGVFVDAEQPDLKLGDTE